MRLLVLVSITLLSFSIFAKPAKNVAKKATRTIASAQAETNLGALNCGEYRGNLVQVNSWYPPELARVIELRYDITAPGEPRSARGLCAGTNELRSCYIFGNLGNGPYGDVLGYIVVKDGEAPEIKLAQGAGANLDIAPVSCTAMPPAINEYLTTAN